MHKVPPARTLLWGQRQQEKDIAIKGSLIIALLGTSLAQESPKIKGIQRWFEVTAASDTFWLRLRILAIVQTMEAYVHFKVWKIRNVTVKDRLQCYEIYWQLVLRNCSYVLIVLSF